jgi:UDP-glucose-4-epimerase GalE
MRILVTGGAGYIGSHTVRALLDEGHHVVVLDLRPAPGEGLLDAARFGIGDIADRPLVERLLDEHAVEGVIHFAAHKSVAESMESPERYFRNNVAGSLSVIEATLRVGVQAFVFSSSCAVYGTPDRPPVDETAPRRPESPYGTSKVIVEDMLAWFSANDRLRYVSLRYFNAAGASSDARLGEEGSRTTMLIPNLMRAVAGRRGPVDIYGTDYPTPDGTAIRDYIHVVDLADAHVRALRYLASGSGSESLNLGTGRGRSVKEVIAAVEKVTGSTVPIRYTGRRPGDAAAIWADPRRAESILGWAARYDLDEIARSAWAWHRSEP